MTEKPKLTWVTQYFIAFDMVVALPHHLPLHPDVQRAIEKDYAKEVSADEAHEMNNKLAEQDITTRAEVSRLLANRWSLLYEQLAATIK